MKFIETIHKTNSYKITKIFKYDIQYIQLIYCSKPLYTEIYTTYILMKGFVLYYSKTKTNWHL